MRLREWKVDEHLHQDQGRQGHPSPVDLSFSVLSLDTSIAAGASSIDTTAAVASSLASRSAVKTTV